MMNQLTIRTYMAIMAERDAAIRERNMALEERKRACAERDMAMLQRDAAIAECNSAIQERDDAIAALSFEENSLNEKIKTIDTAPCGKHDDFQPQMHEIVSAAAYNPRGILTSDNDTFDLSGVAPQTVKPGRTTQQKESRLTKSAKSQRGGERDADGLRKPIFPAGLSGWGNAPDVCDDDEDRQPNLWMENSRVNEIKFDESVMPAPVCSCTGLPQPCYRWGNGGWQSACCTTSISMYPLPPVSNKRYARVGGRKMSGSAFCKLLNRLASEGYDFSTPLDLKDHWAKHGTNRYTIVK